MLTCEDCGGRLISFAEYDGERSFTLYQCEDCEATGGEASGAGLPDASWGALGERIVADGGRIEGEVRCNSEGGSP